MTMNRDLFLAILAMDSYNRGYGENVSGLASPGPNGSSGSSIRIGRATILRDANDAEGVAEAAGFYALAYDLSSAGIDGLSGTVISYRGTNFNINWNPFTFLNSPIISDVISGWSVGVGLPGQQAALALDFYNAVAPGNGDPRDANITTTGHSLGGGLAGFAANVFNREAVLFDHMPYTPISATLEAYLDARARWFGGEEIWEFSDEGVSAHSADGEVLSYYRGLYSSEPNDPIASQGNLGPVQLHSMALLVSLMWALENTEAEWQSAGTQLWNGFFDEKIAKALPGIVDRVGAGGDELAVLQAAIAYSALAALMHQGVSER